jgi:hypothetical protein
MSYGPGPHLPAEEGSGAPAYPMTLDPTSRLGRVQCCHASRGPQWVVGLKYIKKGIDDLPMQLGSCVYKACAYVPKTSNTRAIMGMQDVQTGDVIITCKTCGRGATVLLNIAAPQG